MDSSASGADRDHLPFGQHHAFIIGIDAYEHVSRLQTAVNDAQQLAEVLGRQQHFTVHAPLLDAKGSAIRELLHETLRRLVGKDDRVFFYFAGHGVAHDGDDGPAGYILPGDADPTNVKTWVAMAELQQALEALPCRHLLLVLDCCFSGAFKWSSNYRAIGSLMPKRIYRERFDRFIQDPAWQVITSAGYDQKALDVLGGKLGGRGVVGAQDQVAHSPFALALFEALAGAADVKGDREGDGVITATELYAYIRDQVEPQSIDAGERLRQTPGFFPLKKHDKGEFIFLHPRHRLNLPPTPNRSPYKGLASFDESDQTLFYGRDRVIAELRARAEHHRLLVVSGASGTGKSSVVKAGLLPVLRKAGYRILPVVRPGAHPLSELERSLAEAVAAAPGDAASPPAGPQKWILLIDQFEELITRCADPRERERFVARLRGLLDEGSVVHQVILTVRADFEPQLSGGELKSDWVAGRCTVPPFSLEELKEVILMPTIQEVLIFDPPQLVDDIIAEVVQSPGALPLLSYALNELYEAYRASGRQDRALTRDDYDRLGGVMGALRTKADALYTALPPGEQDTMRKIMLRMVSVEGDLASRRVPMDDLVYTETEEPLVHAVVDKLVDARLIVKGKDYIEPAHDALVRAWKTLHDWIHQAGKDKLILGAKLNAAANEFAQSRSEGLLWNENPHLPVLESELNNPQRLFNRKELAFVELSLVRKRQLLQEREEQLKKIEETQTARAKLQRRATWALSAAAVVVLGLLGWALWQTREVFKGTSGLLAAAAVAASNAEQFDRSLRLGILAAKSSWPSWLHPVHPNAAPILSLSADRSLLRTLFVGHSGAVTSASFSPDGKLVLTASLDGTARLWNAETGRPVGNAMQHIGEVTSASFSRDGSRVITTSDGTARLWDAKTRLPVGKPMEHDDLVTSASSNPDGSLVVTVSSGTVRLWDAASTEQDVKVLIHGDPGDTRAVESASFSRDGTLVVTAKSDGTAWLWAAATGKQVGETLELEASGTSASFSPDGTLVVVTGRRPNLARVWDAKTRLPVGKPMEHGGYDVWGSLTSASFSPDGSLVVTVADDSTARVWDVANGQQVGEALRHGDDPTSASFSPDGTLVLTASLDGTARLWNAKTGRPVGKAMKHGGDGQVKSANFSPDGTLVVTASSDGTARLWDVATGGQGGKPLKHGEEYVDLARFSTDGKWVVTKPQDGTKRLWVAATGKQVSEALTPEDVDVFNSCLDSDSRLVSAGNEAQVRDAETLRPVGKAMKHNGEIKSACFSPDGSRVITASSDGTARLWDAKTGGQVGEAMNHDSEVELAEFSADGRLVITASLDNTARVWDAKTGRPVGEALMHYINDNEWVESASISPDGSRWVLTVTSGTARLWDIFWPSLSSTRALISEVCARKLTGEASKITQADVQASGFLTDEQVDQDVCQGIEQASTPRHMESNR